MRHRAFQRYSTACMCFGLVALALLLLMSFAKQSAAIAQSSSGSNLTWNDLIADEIEILEFVGGGPLTPDERQQAARAVSLGMQGDRAAFLRNYAYHRRMLQRAARDSARLLLVDASQSPGAFDQQNDTQSTRQNFRYAFEAPTPEPGLGAEIAIEQAIIRHHDPTVVLDTRRKHIVSEIDLGFLYQSAAWYAQKVGLPGPSADFRNHLRVWLRQNYLGLNDHMSFAFHEEPQNFLWLVNHLKAPKNVAAARQEWRAGRDGVDVSLANAVVDQSRRWQTFDGLPQREARLRQAQAGVMLGNATSQAVYGQLYARH